MTAATRSSHIIAAALAVGLIAWLPEAMAAKRAVFVLDATTGHSLYARHANARRLPASLTKMIALYILFDVLEGRRLSLRSQLHVFAHAAAQAPVKLWLKAGDTIRVEDAIRAIVTLSANDVASAVGENLAGSEISFARHMTGMAHRLGMAHTQFRNASGLPARGQHTTAHDMALLGPLFRRASQSTSAIFALRSSSSAAVIITITTNCCIASSTSPVSKRGTRGHPDLTS